MGRLLVDGYNVIRRDRALRELERRNPVAGREELLRLLAHGALHCYEVVVVFDGAPPDGSPVPRGGRIHVRHSYDETADSVIAVLCRAGDTVVTDDRGLAADTLDAGPEVWSVAKLLETVRPMRKKSIPPASSPEPAGMSYPRLRRFDVCPRCMFAERDDWVMLCEEDSLLGKPRNFREGW